MMTRRHAGKAKSAGRRRASSLALALAMAAVSTAGVSIAGAAESPGKRYSPLWERDLAVQASDSQAAAPTGIPAGSAALGRFLLDGSIFAHTRDDFADLRLSDGGGKPLGIHVRPVVGVERHCSEESAPVKRLSLRVLGDSAFEAVYLAEDSARLPDRIFISVDARNFEVSLSLWTSHATSEEQAGKSAWVPRLSKVTLFDYSRFVDLRREEARWFPVGDRAIRLRVDGLTMSQRQLVSTLSGQVGNPGMESFQVEKRLLRVDAISFRGTVCESRRSGSLSDTVELASPGFANPIREPRAKRTWYVFPAGRLPLKSLTLRAGTRNFMRSAILAGWPDSLVSPADPAAEPWTWPRVSEFRLHRIDWAGQADSSLRIPFLPSRRFATLALGVLDNDDAPIELLGVGAEAERMEAIFPAQGPGRYLLSYGDPGAEPLRLDFENMLERIPGSATSNWTAGAPRTAPPARRPQVSRLSWLSGDLLLTLGFSLAIAALMALLIMTARKAGNPGKPGGGGPTMT